MWLDEKGNRLSYTLEEWEAEQDQENSSSDDESESKSTISKKSVSFSDDSPKTPSPKVPVKIEPKPSVAQIMETVTPLNLDFVDPTFDLSMFKPNRVQQDFILGENFEFLFDYSWDFGKQSYYVTKNRHYPDWIDKIKFIHHGIKNNLHLIREGEPLKRSQQWYLIKQFGDEIADFTWNASMNK